MKFAPTLDDRHPLKRFRDGIANAISLYLVGLVPVLLGAWLGTTSLRFQARDVDAGFLIRQPPRTLLNAFANWDGVWYASIARNGYHDSENQGAFFVFFPFFPLLGRLVGQMTGFSEILSLLIVSHAALIGCLLLFRNYIAIRFPDWSRQQIDLAIVVLLCLPNGMYLRFAYSESLFLFLTLLAAICMERGFQPWIPAMIVGGATGVRAVGAGFVLVTIYYTWNFSRGRDATVTYRCMGMVLPVLLSLWGIAAYSVFLGMEYGDPLLFQRSHRLFDLRSESPLGQKVWNLLSLEPIWSVYVGPSLNQLSAEEAISNPVFVPRFMNPIYFVAAVLLVAYGRSAKLISTRELLFAAVMLGIPYATKGHDGAMQGLARYVIVVFPAWIVLSRLLLNLPEGVRTVLIGLGFVFLALNSAQFAAWYPLT